MNSFMNLFAENFAIELDKQLFADNMKNKSIKEETAEKTETNISHMQK